jgi:hypothetical protein
MAHTKGACAPVTTCSLAFPSCKASGIQQSTWSTTARMAKLPVRLWEGNGFFTNLQGASPGWKSSEGKRQPPIQGTSPGAAAAGGHQLDQIPEGAPCSHGHVVRGAGGEERSGGRTSCRRISASRWGRTPDGGAPPMVTEVPFVMQCPGGCQAVGDQLRSGWPSFQCKYQAAAFQRARRSHYMSWEKAWRHISVIQCCWLLNGAPESQLLRHLQLQVRMQLQVLVS